MSDKIDIYKVIHDLSKTLSKFSDGRINYSESNVRPILTCFLKYNEEILLLKRSDLVGNDACLWSTVTGYLDEMIEVEDKAYKEVEEETGISKEIITKVYKGEVYEFTDDITWVICPILFILSEKPNIVLNWEHTDYKWIYQSEMNNYNLVSDLYNTLMKIKL